MKFTLPAGTTNRHKWHKGAAKAVTSVTRTFNMQREIYGQHGGESRESLVSVFGAGGHTNPKAVEVYEALGERFSWEITRDNAGDVEQAFREALPRCMETVPINDHRTTPEQDAERAKLANEMHAKRKAEAEAKAERVEALAAELRKQYPNALPADCGKSSQARAAANFKAILQARGLEASVKSDSFSMGDSVTADVLTPDLPPNVRKELREIAERFNYSTFDPMTDSSGYKHDDAGEAWGVVNGRAKYCRVEFKQSDENRAAIAEFLGTEQDAYQVWTGAHPLADEFWNEWLRQHELPKPAEPAAQGGSYRIEKHHHTKRGFDFWLVVLADRVERDEFTRLRSSCKAAGGWYSRKWGSTPGGFAFKEREQAGAWAVQEFGGDDTPPDDEKRRIHDAGSASTYERAAEAKATARPMPVKAEKFRGMAEKLDEEVAAKRGDHRENTPKQQREGMSRRIEADRLERTAQALRALADLHEAGEVPAQLRKFRSKKAVYKALGVRTKSEGYYHVAATDERSDDSPEAAALWALIDGKDPEQEKADRLRDMRADVKGRKIPGYFPTPSDVAADMVDKLDIRHRRPWSLLEPSAGDGALLDAIEGLANVPEFVQVHEINGQLCRILEAKGYDPQGDFLAVPAWPDFDAVLLNPPFEKLQDVEHVRHAFEFLKPGGRLVAIMSPAPFFHDSRKARDFRDWLETLPHEVEEIEAGAFKESGTGVASRLVVIDKPEEKHADTRGPFTEYDLTEGARDDRDRPPVQAALF